MAHRRRIIDTCYRDGCEKEARWEVLDRWNGSLGKFCMGHAKDREREQQDAETKKDQRPWRG